MCRFVFVFQNQKKKIVWFKLKHFHGKNIHLEIICFPLILFLSYLTPFEPIYYTFEIKENISGDNP